MIDRRRSVVAPASAKHRFGFAIGDIGGPFQARIWKPRNSS
jgi:hypothetical protein